MPAVHVSCETVDVQLRDVADERDAAAHVAVQRCVPERDFRLVAAGDQERARVVRFRHHQEPADARVQVLPREASRDRVRVRLEHGADVLVNLLNRDDAVADAER